MLQVTDMLPRLPMRDELTACQWSASNSHRSLLSQLSLPSQRNLRRAGHALMEKNPRKSENSQSREIPIEDDLWHVEGCKEDGKYPRCYFLRNKEVLEAATPVKYFKSTSWLEARMVDNDWGISCLVCSAANMTNEFAKFNIKSYVHKGNYRRHGASHQHQKALNLLNLDNVTTNQKDAPDLEEWKLILDHRRGVTSLSFSVSVEQVGKRWKICKMQWCLAEAARIMVRDFLREAGSIALAQDERQNKLLASWPNSFFFFFLCPLLELSMIISKCHKYPHFIKVSWTSPGTLVSLFREDLGTSQRILGLWFCEGGPFCNQHRGNPWACHHQALHRGFRRAWSWVAGWWIEVTHPKPCWGLVRRCRQQWMGCWTHCSQGKLRQLGPHQQG